MKQCPKCNEIYSDDDLKFCLTDGTVLTDTFDTAKTVLMPSDTVANRAPSTIQPSVKSKSGIKLSPTYASVALAALLVSGIVFWFAGGTKLSNFSSATLSPDTNSSQSANKLEKPQEISSWTFLTEAAGGDIKVSYRKQARTLKLKFTNNGVATAQIKYRMRIEYKTKGEWLFDKWHDSTVTVKAGQEQLDNFPISPVVEEMRNIEVEIVDWNYLN